MNVDPDRLALYVGADPTEPLLPMLAEQALTYLNRETHRYFGTPEERSAFLPGSGTHKLWLPDPPTDPDDVEVREWYLGDEEGEIEDYIVRGRALIRTGGKQWGRRYDYAVDYTAGLTTLPPDIEQAVFDLVRWKFQDLKTASGMVSEKLGDYSYTRGEVDGSGASWVPRLNVTINAYKRNPI